MPLVIADELLEVMGLQAHDALIEFACRMYDAGRLELPAAVRLTGLPRVQFQNELAKRGLPVFRLADEDLERDVASLAAAR